MQLWDARADQTLALADYQALGDGTRCGLAVALAHRADANLQRFTAAQSDIARRILLRLISFGEGRSDTRRQQPRAQLRAAGEDAADFELVLRTMVDHRLLTVDEDAAGSRGRPRARDHDLGVAGTDGLDSKPPGGRATGRRLEVAAAEWVEHGRTARGLLDPIELADAAQWQQTESAIQLGRSAEVVALVAASRTAQNKQRRRRCLVVGVVGLLGLVAAVIAAVAVTEHGQSRLQRDPVRLQVRERVAER